jgi:hypothetical protein
MNTIWALSLLVSTTWARYGQPDYCNNDGMTKYAQTGDLGEILKCMNHTEVPQLTTDMLVAASCNGQYDVVDWLINQGVPVHSNRDDLQCAAGLGYTGIVSLILKQDATYLGRPFVFAAANGHIGVLNVLLAAGGDPNESIYCWYEIKHAPPRLYDGFKDIVMSCTDLAKKMLPQFEPKYDCETEPCI